MDIIRSIKGIFWLNGIIVSSRISASKIHERCLTKILRFFILLEISKKGKKEILWILWRIFLETNSDLNLNVLN